MRRTPPEDGFPRDDEIRRRLGQQLRSLRTARRLSQEAIAERAGMTSKYVGEIERGETNPGATYLVRLARGLEVPVGELFRTITPDQTFAAMPPRALGLLRESVGSLTQLLGELGEPPPEQPPTDTRYRPRATGRHSRPRS